MGGRLATGRVPGDTRRRFLSPRYRGRGGGSDEDRRLARGYSFQIKRIPPRASQEKFRGDFDFPPDPLETTKGRACGPFLWISSRGGTGGRLRGNYGGRRGRFAARRNGGRFFGGRSDGRGRALSRPGAGGLRGTGFRAGASLRTGHGIGNPVTNGAKFCYALCFSFRTTHFAGAGGVGAGDGLSGTPPPTVGQRVAGTPVLVWGGGGKSRA